VIGRHKQPGVEEPAGDIRVEDRRSSTGEARGSRGLSSLVVDYAEDPGGCQLKIVDLTEEYERYVESEHAICPGCPAPRSGPFVVYSMLDWKAIYGDGRLGHWTRDDVCEYLLDHFPRKVSADRRLLGDTPTCVRDFFYFMSDRGTLAGDDLDVLADAADEVFDDFLAANGDRRNWGLAKSMLLGGAAATNAGEDLSVVEAARDLDVSAAIEPPRASAQSSRPGAAARRSKRKAARAARRRNRR